MKIKELLACAVDFLGKRDGALLESELLLAHVLGVEREYLISNAEEDVEMALVDLFYKYVEMIRRGAPIAYITNEKEFFGLNFFVDKRVLVPRPETEMIVEKVLEYFRSHDNGRVFRILDVGTGSGAISVALAKNFDKQELIALDISPEALEVARINVDQHGVEDKIQLVESDLLEAIDDEENFEVIVANLPYIGVDTNSFVEAKVSDHEPKSALFAGSDGLDLYKKMFQQISGKKIVFKLLVGEFGFGQESDVMMLLSKYFDQNWTIEKDLAGIPRIFIVKG